MGGALVLHLRLEKPKVANELMEEGYLAGWSGFHEIGSIFDRL
jgi:hypothetical protein